MTVQRTSPRKPASNAALPVSVRNMEKDVQEKVKKIFTEKCIFPSSFVKELEVKICLKEFVKPENILVGMVEYTSITEIIDPKLLSEGKGQKRDALIQRMEELRLSALEDADKEEAKEINEEVNSALTQINNGTFEVPSLDEQISRVVEEVFEVIRENCAEIQLGRQLQIENFDLSVRVKDLETKVETVFTEAVLGSEYSSREIIA